MDIQSTSDSYFEFNLKLETVGKVQQVYAVTLSICENDEVEIKGVAM